MKKMTKHLATGAVFGISLLLASANAQASPLGAAWTTVDVDWSYTKSVDTAGEGSLLTTEFDLVLDSTALSLSNYETYGYCVESEEEVEQGAHNYLMTSLDELGSDAYYQVAWLVNEYAPSKGSDLSADEQDQAAALQSLIWDVLEGDSFAVTTDDTTVSEYYTQYAEALASADLDDATLEALGDKYMVAVCDGANGVQDLIVQVADDPESVPVPASLLLLGTGLVGLFARGYRRRQ